MSKIFYRVAEKLVSKFRSVNTLVCKARLKIQQICMFPNVLQTFCCCELIQLKSMNSWDSYCWRKVGNELCWRWAEMILSFEKMCIPIEAIGVMVNVSIRWNRYVRFSIARRTLSLRKLSLYRLSVVCKSCLLKIAYSDDAKSSFTAIPFQHFLQCIIICNSWTFFKPAVCVFMTEVFNLRYPLRSQLLTLIFWGLRSFTETQVWVLSHQAVDHFSQVGHLCEQFSW